jgi:hypothetical protein
LPETIHKNSERVALASHKEKKTEEPEQEMSTPTNAKCHPQSEAVDTTTHHKTAEKNKTKQKTLSRASTQPHHNKP